MPRGSRSPMAATGQCATTTLNRGFMGKLGKPLADFLEARVPEGLPFSEAARLCGFLYCTTGNLPAELAHGLTKEVLADGFAILARSGWVKVDTKGSAVVSADIWQKEIRSVIAGRFDLIEAQKVAR